MTQDREGYALAAGLALGLITLGKGRGAAGLADLHLEEKLRWVLGTLGMLGALGTLGACSACCLELGAPRGGG